MKCVGCLFQIRLVKFICKVVAIIINRKKKYKNLKNNNWKLHPKAKKTRETSTQAQRKTSEEPRARGAKFGRKF